MPLEPVSPWSQELAKAYLCREHIVHGQNVDLGVDSKGRLNLRSDDLRAIQGREFVNIASRGDDALESHVAGRTNGADKGFLIVGSKNSVLEVRADVAIRLTVPFLKVSTVGHADKDAYIVSGLKVAATKNTLRSPTLSPKAALAASLQLTTSIFTPVYSTGPKASPDCRS